MNSLLKSLKTPPNTLVTAFALTTALLAAVLVYQQFSPFKVIDFGPMTLWLKIAVPSGIFGTIFLHIRASQRTQRAAQEFQSRIAELEAEVRGGSIDPRHPAKPRLDRPLPDKDPFENL
jgi:hypothetical protein